MLDINTIRKDFQILGQKVYGMPLVYLDNAATTQKPLPVINAITGFYGKQNSNIHRGVHFLSELATEVYESARKIVKDYINARSAREIIFTKGTTDSINIVANSFGKHFVKQNDEIIISEIEHHSNLIPWQMLCAKKGAFLKTVPFHEDGELLVGDFKTLISDKTKFIAITMVSNVLGVITPIKKIIKLAHSFDIPVLIDGAQAVPHFPIDVQDLECDFFAFSGHKLYAETGIGVLYGKERWLDNFPPYQFGGGMVRSVSFSGSVFDELPYKFEAGTPNIAGAASLAEAIRYIKNVGISDIILHEETLLAHAIQKLTALEGVMIYGAGAKRCSLFSFNLNNINSYDTGVILDKMGIAVRVGTLCAEPVMRRFNIEGMVRASFAFYNTIEEVDYFVEGIAKVRRIFNDDN